MPQQQPPHPMVKYMQELELYTQWTDSPLMQLMSRVGPQLEKVTMFRGQLASGTCLQALACYWPRLTQLRLGYHNVTLDSMVAIAQHCPHLRDLLFFRCRHLSSNLFTPFVEAAAANDRCARLEKIDLITAGEDPPWTYQTVLDLAQFPMMTSFTINARPALIQDLLTTVIWPHLTHLELDCIVEMGRDDDDDDDGSGDALVIPFLQKHCQLKCVSLLAMSITNATLDAMATYLPDITGLDLRGNACLTVRGVRRLVRQSRHVAWVDLLGCNISSSEFPEAYYELDLDDPSIDSELYLDPDGVDEIQRIGPQGIYDDDDDDDNNDDDDDDEIWLRLWQRSFINLRLYGSGVA
ncbi:hypothetical protein BCR42DRAFT_443852 [Absidia repens]|uniref:F-box domain-containing protein n=1 Tax=Absidia repens TaxID=90262 RepID=A0A1X2HYG6_9FUNG|nr:hypothetical protein BCR42DRAFT_443852 [Absidia repens]